LTARDFGWWDELTNPHRLDGDTEVFVMADDKIPEFYQNESDGSLKTGREKHDDQDAPIGHRGLSPPKPVAPHPMIPTNAATGATNTAGNISAPQFLSELPVRGGSHLPTQLVQPEMGSEQQASYVESAGIGGVANTSIHHTAPSLPMSEILASPHDTTDRRHSLVFNSPTDFSASGNTAMYSQQWQPASTAPATSPMYSFPHQQTPAPQANYGAQPNMSLQQGQQQYLPQQYEGLQRAAAPFDPNHPHLYRQGPVTQPNVGHTQGYPNYLSSDNRGLPGSSIKPESLPRSHMH